MRLTNRGRWVLSLSLMALALAFGHYTDPCRGMTGTKYETCWAQHAR